ncbi:MAG: M23 family metallopeptidase [Deltaproteobacteria bacterium]|nr:M23 family metallopeptidase [Deltaproteobacteria bacterium]
MKKPIFIIIIMALVVLVGGWWLLSTYLEFEKPAIGFSDDIKFIGNQTVLDILFTDQKSGLRNTTVNLVQNGKTTEIFTHHYDRRGTKKHTLSLPVDTVGLKLRNGPATLQITAVDYSLLKNKASSSRQINIDIIPPRIYKLNPTNHINPGGTCVVVYRLSEPVSMSGVEVNQYLFKGYPIIVNEKPFNVCYFAMPVDAGKTGAQIRIVAEDQAGNKASVSLPYLLLGKKFRNDKMRISDNFLQQKMPDFQYANPDLRQKTLLDTFIYVNSTLREDNFKSIQAICQNSQPEPLWQGTFLRMKNAAPMALFGDKRTYVHNGKTIGNSIHMGVDLASTQQAPVEAANSGFVAFAGDLGIYGNTVIIDHGLGLFSLYAHLSTMSVQKDAQVKKGEIIGTSGLSGLAGGDHLHFSIVVGGRFVDPIEWWDSHWIADNVQKKIAAAQ